MDAVGFRSYSSFIFPSGVSCRKQLKLGIPFYPLKDWSAVFALRKDSLLLNISSRTSAGGERGRPAQKKSVPRRSKGESRKSQSFDGKPLLSPKQEEVLALFRRIRASISKEQPSSSSSKQRIGKLNEEKSTAESVLDVLRQSRKKVKEVSKNKEGDKLLARERSVSWKDQIKESVALHSLADFKAARPPSNFVKRSPVPSPSIPRVKAVALNNEALSATASRKESKPQGIEEMKLVELKELAKSKGIKGYSKLKKSELMELLKS